VTRPADPRPGARGGTVTRTRNPPDADFAPSLGPRRAAATAATPTRVRPPTQKASIRGRSRSSSEDWGQAGAIPIRRPGHAQSGSHSTPARLTIEMTPPATR